MRLSRTLTNKTTVSSFETPCYADNRKKTWPPRGQIYTLAVERSNHAQIAMMICETCLNSDTVEAAQSFPFFQNFRCVLMATIHYSSVIERSRVSIEERIQPRAHVLGMLVDSDGLRALHLSCCMWPFMAVVRVNSAWHLGQKLLAAVPDFSR